ncbi:MAG TPA: VTT domain-containing protein [Gammaproteobacteria bacterium]|nr:VTT domain-containing protein [Gammaproteobacteria bacterium]
MEHVFNFLLHMDRYLAVFTQEHGLWVYALLFIVVFAETGLVVTPFLPGDTLLFIAGALAGSGLISAPATAAIFAIAAILGNLSNYAIGRAIGPRVFKSRSRWLSRRHLEEAHAFFERHGGKTIVLARFLPIIRTFAPFIAGVSAMSWLPFFAYTLAGAIAWVAIVFTGGMFFGNLPFVRDHLTLVILGLVIVSLIPAVIFDLRRRRRRV